LGRLRGPSPINQNKSTNINTSVEANGQKSNEMLIFQKGLLYDDPGISKVIKIALPNLNDMVFRLKELT
jgi:hypothetical protein